MWLTGWQYRKQINLTGSSGAGTNYPILLKIGESSGASGYNFHIEGKSANFPSSKNQGGDLRFTASDGTTLLDFWVEKVTGTSPNRVAYVWVEVSADLGSNQSIYCYYRNSSASNYSNGDNTFLLFDDFDGSTLNSSKWTYGGSYSLSNSILLIGPGNLSFVYSQYSSFQAPIAIESYVRDTSSSGSYTQTWCGFNNYPSGNNAIRIGDWWDKSYVVYSKVVSGTETRTESSVPESTAMNSYNKYKTTYTTSNISYYMNDNLLGSYTSGIPAGDMRVSAGTCDSNSVSSVSVDYIFVRKYTSSEPAFSSAGNEETPPSVIAARRGLIMSM
jgi:hypothetical protein